MNLASGIESLPRITKPHIAALKKLGILTVSDLLFHFPRRYMDFSRLTAIAEINRGEPVSIRVTVRSISSRFSFRGRMNLAEAVVCDASGSLKVLWFNQGYLAKTIKKGDELFLAGTPEYYRQGLQMTNPIYEKVSDFPLHTARLVPVYRLTAGLYPKTFRAIIASALPLADQAAETLPAAVLKNQKLPGIAQTMRFSHFPNHADEAAAAQKRLAFEEIFLNQLLAQQHKIRLAQQRSFAIPFNKPLINKFVKSLPFQLTAGQKKAAWDVLQDLEAASPMNRLVEGDVGSGKTVVALMAAAECAAAGHQAVFLAPTELLAHQHYENALKLLKNSAACALLSNHFSRLDGGTVEKSRLKKLIAEGMPGVYTGTHALLSEKVNFKNLALVIVDEQHRFGVSQRARLVRGAKKTPHLLSLTATPIPRTLQLAYYGELHISQITSKPADRKPIITRLTGHAERDKAYAFMAQQINAGRQAFVITPLIEESETLDVKSAKAEYENMKKIFPRFAVGLLHGRLKGAEKERVMADFLANNIQILVSTSVVEVGVDVPNASVMVIEGAERFGLAQLHQFRGRVGRAQHQSYCLLFTQNENPETTDRLQKFSKTHDGFALAELDLRQRGFGELYGAQQSGWNFKYFSPSYVSLIQPARQEAQNLLLNDLELKQFPLLAKKIQGKVVHFE